MKAAMNFTANIRGRRWLRRAIAAITVLAIGTVVTIVVVASHRGHLAAPEPTTLVRDRHGVFLGELLEHDDAERGFWPLEQVPQRVAAALIAIEDRRFHRHPGVDLGAVARATWQNLRAGETISGASTLPMQIARMQQPAPRTYLNKAIEATTALFLVHRHDRDALLRHYLRLVPFGNRIRGIAYAARAYLDKPVADLSWAEVAFLAAIPQSPARMNPFDPLGRARAVHRGSRILDLLHQDGVLDEVEYAVARQQIKGLRIAYRTQRPPATLHNVLRFADRDDDTPIVDTTLDLVLQDRIRALTDEALADWRRRGAGNAAVLVVERDSWKVRAALGSADYFDDRWAGAIDYLQIPRSSGSTLKPFLYGYALERGVISATTPIDDLARGVGGIGNSDERFLGPLLPQAALANSRNVPAANLLSQVGLDDMWHHLGRLGLHDGGSPRRYGLGLAIGGLPVSLETLVTAYTTLAGDGRRHDLTWYRNQPTAPPTRLFDEATARQITLFLADPQARLPTFPRMGWSELPFPVAIKTGTSSRYRDAWAVAWTREYLIGVWVGHPDHRPMAGLSGYRAATRLTNRILRELHAPRLDATGFPPPRGYRATSVCRLSGRPASPACDRTSRVYMPPHVQPGDPCPYHRHLAVDRRSGQAATDATPFEAVDVRTVVDLPPRYATWAAHSGLPLMPTRATATASAPSTHLRITAPETGARLLRDPETPASLATVALRVTVDPPVEQIVWWVDGAPFATVDYPYEARWPVTPGRHTFQARLPFGDDRSAMVELTVE